MNKNIPNILSAIRIILVPFFVFFYMATFIPHGKLVALLLFIIASLTDLFDGKIARKYNLVSNLGKLLDPIADKVLVLSALLMVTFYNIIPAPYGVIALLVIISRDYVVDALRQISASKGVVIAADIYGKIKTMYTMVALTVLILYAYFLESFTFSKVFMQIVFNVGIVIFAIAVIFTILSGVNYVVKNKALFKDNDVKDTKLETEEREGKDEKNN